MAVRRETIRSQFTEAIGRELEQDEQVVAGAFTVSGPNPMLGLAIGVVSMLLMGMRYYYLAITDRRVILMRASMLSSRPAGLAFADPRSGVQFTDVKTAAVWSSHAGGGEQPDRGHGPAGTMSRRSRATRPETGSPATSSICRVW